MGRITWHTSVTGIVFIVTLLLMWFYADSTPGWYEATRLVPIELFVLYTSMSDQLSCLLVLRCIALQQAVIGLRQ
jgi:hypothetical protein